VTGSIQYHKERKLYYVQWYDRVTKKTYKIYKYRGEYLYDIRLAEKLLACMQADVENDTFRIEKYKGDQWTDVIPYLEVWLETVKATLSPATLKDYQNSIKNHLVPFFRKNPAQLHEIQYDLLLKLLNFIPRSGKGKANVMYCLHRCLVFAWRSGRIPEIPAFPEKGDYNIVDPAIAWIPEDRQIKIIKAIPIIHQPIFWFLKYHLRRPSEAMALHKDDYDPYGDAFIIRRTISARQLVNRTKTGVEHIIPCHSAFKPILSDLINRPSQYISPFLFTSPSSRQEGKRYTHSIMSKLWRDACKRVGENISLYAGLKHSSCCQYINEKGLSMSDLQAITDHARLDSVKRYAKTELARKRELMERKVIRLEDRRGRSGVDS
jgi:integrase